MKNDKSSVLIRSVCCQPHMIDLYRLILKLMTMIYRMTNRHFMYVSIVVEIYSYHKWHVKTCLLNWKAQENPRRNWTWLAQFQIYRFSEIVVPYSYSSPSLFPSKYASVHLNIQWQLSITFYRLNFLLFKFSLSKKCISFFLSKLSQKRLSNRVKKRWFIWK